jgi:hypothetical protein
MNKPIKVVQNSTYPDMYRLEWKDGIQSQDMYNLSRAHDILRNYREYRKNMTLRSANSLPGKSLDSAS